MSDLTLHEALRLIAPSDNGFANDIQRYLNDEPVVACPPSRAYRFKKFARRNKAVLSTLTMVGAALLLGVVATGWQAIRATRERDRAVHAEQLARDQAERANRAAASATTEATVARAVNEFINQDLLGAADPNAEPNRDLKVREVLDRASQNVENRFADQPLVKARILFTLGTMYLSLGEYGKAEQHLERSRRLYQQERGRESADTLKAIQRLANAVNLQGRHQEAEKLDRELLEIKERTLGGAGLSTLATKVNLANAMHRQGRSQEAEKLCLEVLEVQRRTLGPEHPAMLTTMTTLANAMQGQGRSQEAEKLYRQVSEIQQRAVGAEHPSTLATLHNLAVAINRQGRYEEGQTLYREVWAIQRRVLGPEHPATLKTMRNLAQSHTSASWSLSMATDLSQGKAARAVELAQRAIELQPDDANHWSNLGVAQYRAGHWQAAVEALEKADAMREQGDRFHRMFLAMAYWQLGDKEKARARYAQGAAWMASRGKDNEAQNRFRAEAEQLMQITEQDRQRMVDECLARPVKEEPDAPDANPSKEKSEGGHETSSKGDPQGRSTTAIEAARASGLTVPSLR